MDDTLVHDQVIEEIQEPRVLSRYHDRCDKCGAQGFMLALNGELELVFCGHHGRKFAAALAGQGFTIEDHTDLINNKPSVSANNDTNTYDEEEE